MKTNIIVMLALVALFSACSKSKIESPDFNVTTQTLNYKVGDTVKFELSGYADYIYFFSGEPGKEFAKKNLYENDKNGVAKLKFTSTVSGGSTTANNLSVLVSNDFNGLYDTVNVKKATWQDITSVAALAGAANIDLTPYTAEGKPIYLAYKYLEDSPDTKNQRTWTISALSVNTTHADGEVYTNAASVTDGLFKSVEFKGDSATWTVNLTTLTHKGLAAGYPGDNDWLISTAFNLRSAIGDAAGVTTIKNLTTGFVPTEQTQIYTKAGTYQATIVARNANIDGSKEKIFDFTITVTP